MADKKMNNSNEQDCRLRIVLVVEDGRIFCGRFVTGLLRLVGDEIVAICIVKARKKNGLMQNMLRNAHILGIPQILKLSFVVAFRRLVSSLPLFVMGPERVSAKRAGRHFGKEVHVFEDLNSSEANAVVKSLNPDVILSSVNTIMKSAFLSIPKIACLNKHNAILPSYGGLFPVLQAVVHGETFVGLTIHKMTEQIDSGEILFQHRIEIAGSDTIWSLYHKCYNEVAPSFVHAINVLKGKEKPLRVSVGEKSYYSYPSRSDWGKLKDRGIKFI